MHSVFALCAYLTLCLFLLSPAQAADSRAGVQKKLDVAAKTIVNYAAKHILPSKKKKHVQREGNRYVATYIEIQPQSLSTELHPGATKGSFVGIIKYHEQHYACYGTSKKHALAAACTPRQQRRISEIISYDKGKWHY